MDLSNKPEVVVVGFRPSLDCTAYARAWPGVRRGAFTAPRKHPGLLPGLNDEILTTSPASLNEAAGKEGRSSENPPRILVAPGLSKLRIPSKGLFFGCLVGNLQLAGQPDVAEVVRWFGGATAWMGECVSNHLSRPSDAHMLPRCHQVKMTYHIHACPRAEYPCRLHEAVKHQGLGAPARPEA